MANIQNESGFNPARHEDKNAYGDGLGEGYGLCQWSYSRKTSLLSFLQENGFAEDSIDGQLWFFKTEIESSERTAWNAIKDLPNTSDGAYEAGRLWCLKFERPRDGVGDSVERGNLAQNLRWGRTTASLSFRGITLYLRKNTPTRSIRTPRNSAILISVKSHPSPTKRGESYFISGSKIFWTLSISRIRTSTR